LSQSNRDLLSLGVFLIIIVVAIVLLAAGIIDWSLLVPVVLVLSGALIAASAAFKPPATQKYAPTAFYRLSAGLLLMALGGAWYLLRFNWLYTLALVLVVLAVIAIAAGTRRK
jgi:hypothetical protein